VCAIAQVIATVVTGDPAILAFRRFASVLLGSDALAVTPAATSVGVGIVLRVYNSALTPTRRSLGRQAVISPLYGVMLWLVNSQMFARCRYPWLLVRAWAVPFGGGGSGTPARRAFDRPIAIACSGDRAPCFPSRMWCISSRTNSPAALDGRSPLRSLRLAFSIVSLSGIAVLRDDTRHDAAIGDDGERLASYEIADDRKRTAIALDHHPGRIGDRRVRCAAHGISRHHISYAHEAHSFGRTLPDSVSCGAHGRPPRPVNLSSSPTSAGCSSVPFG
jgi:hypothetical protein